MSFVERIYRVRVATPGADAVTGNEDFTLDVTDLHGVPVVTSQIVHPTEGRSESRPFSIEVLAPESLIAALTSDERWDGIGRLLDVRFSDNAGGAWTTYGTGRISALGEGSGPGKATIEVSDESWKGRKSRIFTAADTCQMWPHGIKARWGEYNAATPATGSRVATSGDLYRIKMVAGDGIPASRDVLPALLDFADRDKLSFEDLRFGADATGGNFEHLRVNYDGTDYEIISFGPIDIHNSLVGTLEEPAVSGPQSEFRTVTVHAWVYSPSVTPPASGDAFLHAPTAEPSEENPLHVGLADATHTWGAADTGLFLPQEIHPATLTRIYWDETGQVYDDASVTALENDSSFRKVAPLIRETPKDPDAWFQKHVWGPSLIAALTDDQGRRKLVDMRQPQGVDPETLPVIDASNARGNTWRLTGRETVNSVLWRLLELHQHGRIFSSDQAVQPPGSRRDDRRDRACDGIAVREAELGPFPGDTQGTVGTHELTIEALTLHRYHSTPFFDRRRGRERWLEVQSRELFDIYQDGASKGSIEVGRTLAETLDEGDLAILDQDSLKGSNPQTQARSGQRLVRILTMERHPTHAVATYLDLGKKAQPLAAPTVSVAQSVSDEELVEVTVSNVPAEATAILEFGYSSSSTPPDEWGFRREGVGNETIVFGDAPGTGWAHAQVKSVETGRIRSVWASANVQLNTRPKVTEVRVELDGSEAVVFGTPDANTAGVRITYQVHDPEDDPSPANASDFDATNLSDGIALDGVEVGRRKTITVEVEPWTGWDGANVTGSAGPKVSASFTRDEPLFEVIFDHWEYRSGLAPDETGGPLYLYVAHLQIEASDHWQSMHVEAIGQAYDFNFPSQEFTHRIRDDDGGSLDPPNDRQTPAPWGQDSETSAHGPMLITPYTAANGAQGSGTPGPTISVPWPDAVQPWDEGGVTGYVLVQQASGRPTWEKAPSGGISPGADGQVLFTRSGATTWDDIQASDLPSHTHAASQVTPGTFASGGGYTFPTAVTMQSTLDVEATGVITVTQPGTSPSGSQVVISSPAGSPGVIIFEGDGAGGVLQRWDIRVEGGDLRLFDNTGNRGALTIPNSGSASFVSENSGLGITNVTGLILRNADSTTGNWAGLLMGDADGQAGLIGTKTTDHANNFGYVAIATRESDGFLERIRFTKDGTIIPSGKKFFLDGGGNSFIWERTTNQVAVEAGGVIYAFEPTYFGPGATGKDSGRSNFRWSTIYGVDLDLSGDIAFSGGGDIGTPSERVGNIYTGFLSSTGNVAIAGQGHGTLQEDSLTTGTDPTHTVNWNNGNVHEITLGGYSGTAAITIGGASTNQKSSGTYRVILTASGGTRAYSISGVTAWVTPEPDGSLTQDTSVIIYVEVYGSTVFGFATADIPTPV